MATTTKTFESGRRWDRAPIPETRRARIIPLRDQAPWPDDPFRVAVFTTSYPRHPTDMAGFNTVEQLRAWGIQVEVVGPWSYREFGLTTNNGGGLFGNLMRRPWLAVPMLLSMALALRAAARRADLVHANWLAGGLVAAVSGRPFVVTLHGSGTAGRFQDLNLARRVPWLVRLVLCRARAVICCSEQLADAMRACGLGNVRAIPYGVHVPPADPSAEDDPPAVLFAGRLSPEKNIDVIAEATAGLPRIVAGDGPLRSLLPDTLGYVSPDDMGALYDRAAVVVLASRAEGLPNVVLEAMAHGKTVIATPVGGIPTVIEDGKTGLLVPVGDADALRAAIERALNDPQLRSRLGDEARRRVAEYCSWTNVLAATLGVYAEAVPKHSALESCRLAA